MDHAAQREAGSVAKIIFCTSIKKMCLLYGQLRIACCLIVHFCLPTKIPYFILFKGPQESLESLNLSYSRNKHKPECFVA